MEELLQHKTAFAVKSLLALVMGLLPCLLAAEPVDVGLAKNHVVIEGVSIPGAPGSPTVLLIGGMHGDDATSAVVQSEIQTFQAIPTARRQYNLLAVPVANPANSPLKFPPEGKAYRDNPEANYLWRFIGTHAPDLALIAGPDDSGLADALSNNAVAGIGRIPARRVDANEGILKALPQDIPQSEGHQEITRRLARSPRQVAEQLAKYYGHEFNEPVYIPGVALIGQLRLGNLAEVERLAAPYVDGSKDSMAKLTGSHLAGHLVFAELAARTGDPRYTALVKRIADLGFTETGAPKESMPLHDEMSDSVFMGCPILAAAGKLTGQSKYFDMAARHYAFMRKLDLRPDGIYRHSPLCDAAWGRGNAFPALGLALTLSMLPPDHLAFRTVLHAFQEHMAALVRFQNNDGMWREVIDQPGAYSELSATAMIGTAMLRGIANGWLQPGPYMPRVEAAWRAVSARTGDDGRLVDVCEGTGKQKTLDDYLNRMAILDRDPRGGAMALLFATEMMQRR